MRRSPLRARKFRPATLSAEDVTVPVGGHLQPVSTEPVRSLKPRWQSRQRILTSFVEVLLYCYANAAIKLARALADPSNSLKFPDAKWRSWYHFSMSPEHPKRQIMAHMSRVRR